MRDDRGRLCKSLKRGAKNIKSYSNSSNDNCSYVFIYKSSNFTLLKMTDLIQIFIVLFSQNMKEFALSQLV